MVTDRTFRQHSAHKIVPCTAQLFMDPVSISNI